MNTGHIQYETNKQTSMYPFFITHPFGPFILMVESYSADDAHKRAVISAGTLAKIDPIDDEAVTRKTSNGCLVMIQRM